MEKKRFNQNAPIQQEPKKITSPTEKKHHRALWTLFLVFFAIVAIVFLTKHRDTIDWIEDYETGIKLAKQQNKPVLLAFYNQNISFCWAMDQYVYNNPDVIKYAETKFIPILIDIDKQPEIVKQYNIDYYPTHYVGYPDSNELSEPLVGCVPNPRLFIERIDHLLNTIKRSNK